MKIEKVEIILKILKLENTSKTVLKKRKRKHFFIDRLVKRIINKRKIPFYIIDCVMVMGCYCYYGDRRKENIYN